MNNLKKLRKEKGLTIANFAKLVNLSESCIGMYERGERNISVSSAIVFANFFNVPLAYILNVEDLTTKSEISEIERFLTDEQKKEIYDFALFLASKNKQGDKTK